MPAQQTVLNNELNVSVDFEFGLSDNDDKQLVEFCVNRHCKIMLTIEEARLLAIKFIQAANQAEVRRHLLGKNRCLARI